MKVHENLPRGSRVVSDGWPDAQTDMITLVVAFRNFATAPKNEASGTLPVSLAFVSVEASISHLVQQTFWIVDRTRDFSDTKQKLLTTPT
jgi:hypothetical protein